jgi:hypothetical protein
VPKADFAEQSAMRFCFQRNGDTEAPARRPFGDRFSTASVNQETRIAMQQFLTPRFVARKTLNQRGLQFSLSLVLGWIPGCIIRMCQQVRGR